MARLCSVNTESRSQLRYSNEPDSVTLVRSVESDSEGSRNSSGSSEPLHDVPLNLARQQFRGGGPGSNEELLRFPLLQIHRET